MTPQHLGEQPPPPDPRSRNWRFVLTVLARSALLAEPEPGWFAAALFVLTIYLRPEFDLPSAAFADPLTVSLADLACMAVIVWLTWQGARGTSPCRWRHPVFQGVFWGVALSLLRLALPPAPDDDSALNLAVAAIFVPVLIWCALNVTRARALAHGERWILICSIGIGLAAEHLVPHDLDPLSSVSVIKTVLTGGAALSLLGTCIGLFEDGFGIYRQRLTTLSERAAAAEYAIDHDAELRHECRATLAGISSASELLISQRFALEPEQTQRLRAMLESEMTRLQTLLDSNALDPALLASPALSTTDLHSVVEPMVLAMQQRINIGYRRTRAQAVTSPEVLQSVLTALLRNAETHAPGAAVTIWTTSSPVWVQIHVADDGPGLRPEVAEQLFERGERDSTAPGEGLGLFTARRDLRRIGGDLRAQSGTDGAHFVIYLPKAV